MTVATHSAKVNGTEIAYCIDGSDDNPWLVMSHSLAAHSGMWAPQMTALTDRFRVLRFDTRGHGGSPVNKAADFSVMAGDVIGLLDHLGIDRTYFAGLSMGGMIGQQLAIHHGDRLNAVVLCDTTSVIPPDYADMFAQRAQTARDEGMQALVAPTLERWFTPEYLAERGDEAQPVADMIAGTPVEGYADACGTITTLDMTGGLPSVAVPVLVIVGEHDPGTPVAAAQAIHAAIPGSEMKIIEDASHFSNWQQPEVFNDSVTGFLGRY